MASLITSFNTSLSLNASQNLFNGDTGQRKIFPHFYFGLFATTVLSSGTHSHTIYTSLSKNTPTRSYTISGWIKNDCLHDLYVLYNYSYITSSHNQSIPLLYIPSQYIYP